MSGVEDPTLEDGRLLSELKVVELKKVLDRYGLSKVGNKNILKERLRDHLSTLLHENGDGAPPAQASSSPSQAVGDGNTLVAEYLAKQQQALQAAKKVAEQVRAAATSEDAVEGSRESSPRSGEPEPDARSRSRSPSAGSEHEQEDEDQEEVEAHRGEEDSNEHVEKPASPVEEERMEASGSPVRDKDSPQSDEREPSPSPEPEEIIEETEKDQELEDDSPEREESVDKVVEMDDADEKPIAELEEEKKPVVRKRKWGKTRAGKRPTAVAISTDSLKDIIKDVTVDDDAAAELDFDEGPPEKPKRVVVAETDETDEVQVEPPAKRIVVKDESLDSTVRDVHMEEEERSLTEEGLERRRSPSPARYPTSQIIHIRCLTRPFTLPQLHQLLEKFGTFDRSVFWIDNIKSNCIVKYETEEQAVRARQQLHNVIWPTSNPKQLRIDFATQEDIDRHVNPTKPQPKEESRPERAQEEEKVKERRPSSPRPTERTERKRSARSPRRTEREQVQEREWDRGKRWKLGESPPRQDRRQERRRPMSRSPLREQKPERPPMPERPANLLDELFRKTKVTPCIYWLPLTEEQFTARQQAKEQQAREQKERFERLHKLEEEEERERTARRRDWDSERRPVGGRRSPPIRRGR